MLGCEVAVQGHSLKLLVAYVTSDYAVLVLGGSQQALPAVVVDCRCVPGANLARHTNHHLCLRGVGSKADAPEQRHHDVQCLPQEAWVS